MAMKLTHPPQAGIDHICSTLSSHGPLCRFHFKYDMLYAFLKYKAANYLHAPATNIEKNAWFCNNGVRRRHELTQILNEPIFVFYIRYPSRQTIRIKCSEPGHHPMLAFNLEQQINKSVGITEFIVIPAHHLYQATHHRR